MKFLIDAQLPMVLKNWLVSQGHDAIHTRELPEKNFTVDSEIIRIASEDDRIVTTKDSDFHKLNQVTGKPERILMITTGNIVNNELIQLFEANFEVIEKAFSDGNKIVELSNEKIVIHE